MYIVGVGVAALGCYLFAIAGDTMARPISTQRRYRPTVPKPTRGPWWHPVWQARHPQPGKGIRWHR